MCTNLVLHFCAKEEKKPISVTGYSLIHVSFCLEGKAALRSGDHRCCFRKKLLGMSPGISGQYLTSVSGNT